MRITKVLDRLIHRHGTGLIDVELGDGVKDSARERITRLYGRLEVLDAEVRLDEARRERYRHRHHPHGSN